MPNTIRGQLWHDFASKVESHIEEYTVPQYGDAPTDQVEAWTAQDCMNQIRKYVARFGSNVRQGQEQLDLMKIAHYAQLCSHKLEKEQQNED